MRNVPSENIEKSVVDFEAVKEYVLSLDHISISKLQCEYSIGWVRARKLMQELIAAGVVEEVSDLKFVIKK